MKQRLTAVRLREVLDYDPQSGVFKWRISTNRSMKVGDIAGTNCRGYVYIGFSGTVYRAHRLAWLYVNGVWPTLAVDHKNRNRADNRIANLREATALENNQNRIKAHSTNRTGFVGASALGGKYRARIRAGGKEIMLGYFPTPQEASKAYLDAKRSLHAGGYL